jgi:hypothetical protein
VIEKKIEFLKIYFLITLLEMTTNNEIIKYFETKQCQKVLVNDIEFDCYKGLETMSGYYKNGFKAYVKKGKKKNKANEYLQIDIYTSAGQQIDIEEKFMFLKDGEDYILKKWVGWNNMDLLRFDTNNEFMNMLESIYYRNLKSKQ